MRPEVLARLAALNRAFYAEQGEAFAATRPRLAAGIRRVLERVPAGAQVLEAGCGDGKVGRWLARNVEAVTYVGLDASAVMLERAQRYTEPWAVNSEQSITSLATAHSSLRFLNADLLTTDWSSALSDQLFDWVFAFAVFHHLPGAEARARVMGTLAGRLRPGGWLALSNWQFTRSERLRRRLAAWDRLGLAEADVETGDYLLTWERGAGRGLRYVHLLDEAEARGLAAGAGLAVREVFQADGHSGDLAEYVLLHKPAGGTGQTEGPAADVSLI